VQIDTAPGCLRRFSAIFRIFFNSAKKTQDVYAGFSADFNTFFTFAKKTQDV
jgi:hypothetical protein